MTMVWPAIRERSFPDPRICADVAARPVLVSCGVSYMPDEDGDCVPAPRMVDDPLVP